MSLEQMRADISAMLEQLCGPGLWKSAARRPVGFDGLVQENVAVARVSLAHAGEALGRVAALVAAVGADDR